MAKAKPSWTDKLNRGNQPVIKPCPLNFAGMRIGQTMLIPSPQLLDAFIRQIPKGKAMDIVTLRARLAKENGAEVACPVTTGILLRIVTEAANESFDAGIAVGKITPVWRVIDAKAPILKKISFAPEWMMDQRAREGLP
jgi:hypothetical protein